MLTYSRYPHPSTHHLFFATHFYLNLIRSNKMQQYADICKLQNHSTCFGWPSHPSSGVHKTVTVASGTGHSILVTTFLQRDLYQRLQLHFYVLLMMGVMDTRNMYSDFAVYKYLHTVASCWILLTESYNARNHEYKILP
jgi:hypothetical protein